MIFQKIHTRRFLNEAGEGGDEGGGGAAPDVAALQSQIAALDKKNKELLGEKKTLKGEFDSFKTQYDGIDPEAVRGILKRFTDDEEASLIAKGEIDTVLNKRTERLKDDFGKKLTAAEQRAVDAEKRMQAYEGRVLDDSIRAAAAKAGLHQQAIEDALFRGRTMFRLDANGQAVQLDEGGNPIPGKDGKTAYTPAEWLEDMKEKAPHWFPATASGGGARGGSGASGASTMTRAQFDALDAHGRTAAMRKGVKLTD